MNKNLLGMGLAMAVALGGSAQAAGTPDLSGFWKPAQPVSALRTSDGKAPPLNALGQKLYAANQAAAKAGDRSFDNGTMCRPLGVPRLLTQSAFELGQTPRDVVFLYQWNRLQRPAEVRNTHSDFDHAYPYYLGHPIARWDGNALVLDSVYFNEDTILDDSGLPHSDALHVVERYTLKDKDTLVATVTIDDSKLYSQSWQTTLTFQRMSADTRLPEDVCEDRLGLQNLNTNKNRLPVENPK
ncbi:MAG: hypothetical protein QM718_03075 [Steroidobacteraceae bacterium]